MVPVRTEGASSYEDVANFQTLQYAQLRIVKLKIIRQALSKWAICVGKNF